MRFKILLLLPIMLYARPGYEDPWGKDAQLVYPSSQAAAPTPSIPVRIANQVIRFHQNVLSPVDGPRSHFRPSSSEYMRLAMQKHGFFKGFALGCDRLLRENSAPWVYRTIEVDGQLVKYDPVP